MNGKASRCRSSASQHASFDRRAFLQAAGGVASLAAPGAAPGETPAVAKGPAPLGLPGPYPGRVVEVRHPGSIRDGVPDLEAVRAMVARGITGLTAIAEPV